MSSPETPEPGKNPLPDEAALEARYQQLKDKMEASAKASGADDDGKGGAMGRAMRMGSEFVVAVLVGTFIGWQLDKWLDTKPWLLILFLLFGFGAGMRNVLQLASKENRENKKE
ncbi:MAG: hypothetical protein DHS20C08_18230 [Rhodomicrobium sp.]|nr:MAG: hypothetical protein DHS20C08_18230 [Rhodomicrobium sp.]